MLCFENVRKVYKDFELNCSMRVEPGCITGLIGPNGAGKSTAFKAALGLIRTDGGTDRRGAGGFRIQQVFADQRSSSGAGSSVSRIFQGGIQAELQKIVSAYGQKDR